MDEREQLELEKIRMELELLKKELSSGTGGKTTGDRIKEWLPIGLTFIGIIGGLLTFWVKADAYLTQIEKENEQARFQHEINFNKEIIELIDDLNDEDRFVQEYAALMLTSYNLNSVPVLMFLLERKRYEENQIYIQTLRNIFRKESIDRGMFFERIVGSTRLLFMKEYGKMDGSLNSIDAINFDGIGNHMALFKALAPDMSDAQKASTHAMLAQFEDKLSEKEIHRDVIEIVADFIQESDQVLNVN